MTARLGGESKEWPKHAEPNHAEPLVSFSMAYLCSKDPVYNSASLARNPGWKAGVWPWVSLATIEEHWTITQPPEEEGLTVMQAVLGRCRHTPINRKFAHTTLQGYNVDC
jgi:hypothetical protein